MLSAWRAGRGARGFWAAVAVMSVVRIWLGSDGRVVRAELGSSTGNAELDKALHPASRRLAGPFKALPADLLQPVVMRTALDAKPRSVQVKAFPRRFPVGRMFGACQFPFWFAFPSPRHALPWPSSSCLYPPACASRLLPRRVPDA